MGHELIPLSKHPACRRLSYTSSRLPLFEQLYSSPSDRTREWKHKKET